MVLSPLVFQLAQYLTVQINVVTYICELSVKVVVDLLALGTVQTTYKHGVLYWSYCLKCQYNPVELHYSR